MRRVATVGLLLLGGGCAEFDDWMEPGHTAEYRRGGYQRDARSDLRPDPMEAPADQGPGVYQDR